MAFTENLQAAFVRVAGEFNAIRTALGLKQNASSELTTIAALVPTNNDVLQRKSGSWVNRTPSQIKTDLALAKSDVGLGNVDNTSDAGKPLSTATTSAFGSLERNIVRDGAATAASNNATIIQAAIDAVAASGGGTVVIPPGEFLTGPLKLKTRVGLQGHGWGSKLKLINGANDHLLSLATIQVEQTRVENLWLDGNSANQSAGDAINLDNTGYDNGTGFPSLGDPNHYLRRVGIIRAKRHGVYVAGSFHQTQMISVVTMDCDENGIFLGGPDCHLDQCVTARSGLEGIYIASNSERLLGCKSWLSGRLDATRGDGFRIHYVSRADLTHCESQDNRRHGFMVNNTQQSMLTGCKADRNGLGADPVTTGQAGDGLYATGVTKSTIQVTTGDRNAGTVLQRYGYQCSTGNDENLVQISVGNTTSGSGVGSWGPNSAVQITQGGKLTAPVPPAVQSTKTAAYTFALVDSGTEVAVNSSSAVTVTVPPNTDVPFPIGATIDLAQTGAGQVTVAGGAGVTVNSRGAALKLAGQHAQAALRKTATDTWRLVGDVTA